MIFKVGPRANAIGCILDPSRLGDSPHCQPLVNLGPGLTKRARGSDRVLRALQDARSTAQSRGITIDGEISGAFVDVVRVGTGRPSRTAEPVTIAEKLAPVVRRALRVRPVSVITKTVPLKLARVTAMDDFDRPSEARPFVHKKIGGFLKRKVLPTIAGFIPGGNVALDIGTSLVGGRGGRVAPPQQILPFGLGQTVALPQFPRRPPPQQRGFFPQQPVQLPSTPTITTPAERSVGPEFQAVQGAFGLPAMAPFAEQRVVLDCPKGMVLGMDNLCYPKAVLRRNSQFRKWKSSPRPTISRRDERALTALDSVTKNLKTLGKKAGLKVHK